MLPISPSGTIPYPEKMRARSLAASLLLSALPGATLPSAALAMPSNLSFKIEPIVGYERVQKVYPTPHSRDRLLLGARAIGGIPLVSAEVEFTRSQDSEDFPTLGKSVKDADDKLKLGLRSSHSMSTLLSAYIRAGGEARRTTREETEDGVTTKSLSPVEYNPYAGLGVTARLSSRFELNAGITAVFNEFPKMSKNDYQTSLSFAVRIP